MKPRKMRKFFEKFLKEFHIPHQKYGIKSFFNQKVKMPYEDFIERSKLNNRIQILCIFVAQSSRIYGFKQDKYYVFIQIIIDYTSCISTSEKKTWTYLAKSLQG